MHLKSITIRLNVINQSTKTSHFSGKTPKTKIFQETQFTKFLLRREVTSRSDSVLPRTHLGSDAVRTQPWSRIFVANKHVFAEDRTLLTANSRHEKMPSLLQLNFSHLNKTCVIITQCSQPVGFGGRRRGQTTQSERAPDLPTFITASAAILHWQITGSVSHDACALQLAEARHPNETLRCFNDD